MLVKQRNLQAYTPYAHAARRSRGKALERLLHRGDGEGRLGVGWQSGRPSDLAHERVLRAHARAGRRQSPRAGDLVLDEGDRGLQIEREGGSRLKRRAIVRQPKPRRTGVAPAPAAASTVRSSSSLST